MIIVNFNNPGIYLAKNEIVKNDTNLSRLDNQLNWISRFYDKIFSTV